MLAFKKGDYINQNISESFMNFMNSMNSLHRNGPAYVVRKLSFCWQLLGGCGVLIHTEGCGHSKLKADIDKPIFDMATLQNFATPIEKIRKVSHPW